MVITLTEFKVIQKYKELEEHLNKDHDFDKEEDIFILLKFMFELTDKGFEYYVKDYFQKQYKYDWIKVTGGVNDGGVDIEGMLGKKHTLIQCKQFKLEHTKDKEILKFISDTKKYRNEIGKVLSLYFVTTSWVSPDAYNYANQHNISIKNYKDIIKMNKKLNIDKYINDHKNDKNIVTGDDIFDILDKKYFKQVFGKLLGTIIYYIRKLFLKNYELDYQKVEHYYPKEEKNMYEVLIPGYSKSNKKD